MAFETFTFGKPGNPVLLFLHGFPDDHTVWNSLIKEFSKRYFCISVDFPNSGKVCDDLPDVSFDAVTKELGKTVFALLPNPQESLTLIAHDWGAVYAYSFAAEFPERVRAIATLDVGNSISHQPSMLGYFVAPAYQLGLAAGYLLSGVPVVGEKSSKALSGAVLSGLKLLGPKSERGKLHGPSRLNPYTPKQNYPYFSFWKQLFTFSKKSRKLPDVPLFFAFGTCGMKKVMQFHDEKWLQTVRKSKHGRVVEFSKSGHWLMNDEPEKLQAEMQSFLQSAHA